MEEKERKVSVERKSSLSAKDGASTAPAGGRNVNGAATGVRGTGGGLAGIARMLGTKAKGQDGPQNGTGGGSKRLKGCEDDLPLGSEGKLQLFNSLNFEAQGPVDYKSKTRQMTQSKMIGWQSFSSDVSNQTSASSASLEILLNERQVDPEEVLLNLGFGLEREGFVPSLARIPERFLHHPTRASGIRIPGLGDDMESDVMEEDEETETNAAPSTGVVSPATSAPPARKRPGIWTLARTLSMLRMKTPLNRAGHMSPSRTPPLPHQPASILLPINQKYLASKGYYRQQGWPEGTFEAAEEEHTQEEKDNWRDAATRRRKFQKTKSNRHWSLCGSNENVNELPNEDREWVSKSMDDSISGDLNRSRNDSRGTCFSTNTESSTDSLDTPNPETERAFEEIRRQYNESLAREQSSSEDLFLPMRHKKRLSSDLIGGGHDLDEDNESDHGLELLSTNDTRSNNYFISPASSRQATVEKAPTLSEQTNSINIDDVDVGGGGNRQKDGNNNKNKYSSSDHNEKSTSIGQDFYDDLDKENCSDVRIIVSSSDSGVVKHWTNNLTHDALGMKSPMKLTVKTIQRASSDSGSTSSSGTAIGSCSIATTTDDLDTLRLSESEVTDRDSLSGANSPYSFSQRLKQTTASSCQTCDDDFRMAASIYQNVSVSTISSGNITVRNARIQQAGVRDSKKTPDTKGPRVRGRGELIHLEDGPKVQLSSLPPTINPLELMKRLRHSQDELSRMGSVQSDSSGFGDSDLAADAGNVDIDFLKVASLGSSSESSTTTATLQGPSKGEMATQTSVDSVRGKKVNARSTENKNQQQSTKPETGSTHYVTMCYIPSLASKAEHNDVGLPGANNPYPNGPRSRVASDAGSETRRAFHDSYDKIGFTRPRGNSDFHLNYGSHGRHYSSVRTHAESISDSPRMYFNHDTGQRRARNNDSSLRRNLAQASLPGHNSRPDSSPQLSQRKFTSNLDLYTNESGLHSRGEMSYLSHTPLEQRRRHSNEGLLSGRNDTPLSVELAQAVGSFQSPASENVPPSTTVSSSVYIQPSVNTIHGRQGLHFPTLAGNLSKLTTELHSTPVESRVKMNPSRQRSCDILDDDFSVSDGDLNPTYARSETASPQLFQTHVDGYPGSDSPMFGRRMTSSWQRQSSNAYSEDLDSYSSMAESSSDFSVHSSPEGHPTSGVLDSRKLARLINQPVFFKGKRRTVCHYRPRRIYKEWTFLSKRKRLQEENRLLQYAIQKYKTDLSIMETSFMVDYQTVYADMTDEERDEIEELEWLWSEVKGQVMEMEQLLMARIKSVHAGNDFHSLMSSMGIINRMIELIKEQIYLQQVANSRVEDDPTADDFDGLYNDDLNYDRRHSSFQGGLGRLSNSMSHPPPVRRTQSSSMSNLPNDLNISLEQIKSSLLSQVQLEIKESTKKLESDLKEKDKEIQQLKDQMARATDTPAKPIRKWTPKSLRSQSFISGKSEEGSPLAKSQRSRLVGDRVVQESDV
ncbi:unnamed protein product [Lymnaea stagnalis]|uniref:ITPR-interacting domain-containing protein n=1 Tax=Lymnaea stagnalis TaxID=6523 RepID=A0AAV2HHP2_LYMST